MDGPLLYLARSISHLSEYCIGHLTFGWLVELALKPRLRRDGAAREAARRDDEEIGFGKTGRQNLNGLSQRG